MAHRTRIGLGMAMVIMAVTALLTQLGGPTKQPSAQAVTAAATGPARVSFLPAADTTDVQPHDTVLVRAAEGVLTHVQMINESGKTISGIMTSDNAAWSPTGPLGYSRTYTLTVNSRGPSGTPARHQSTFKTVSPRNQTAVTLKTTSGAAIAEGGTYGVGTVIVAHFDEPIADRAAAERRLHVTTSPAVDDGSWYWVDNQNAHWRPAEYYQPGTEIAVDAQIYGARLGGGLYGQRDTGVRFRIGDARIAIADDATKQITVYENGRLVRTIPTSMGMGGSETIGTKQISFWTQPGVYTVMDKANPVIMDSSTYGLPINSPLGYRETINYAVRLTNNGIYLHELESTVWAQGNTNVSHGCLNVSAARARWFYDFVRPGDVVEVRNTGGQPLQIWQNGDWSVSWDQWLAGSALRR